MESEIRKKDVIEGVVMGIIVVLMCIAFARSNSTGYNNLFWIFLVALISTVVIWLIIGGNYMPAWAKQLLMSAIFLALHGIQCDLIMDQKIPETCQHYWLNFSISLTICIFNIAVCIADWKDDKGPYDEEVHHVISVIISVISGILILKYIYLLLNLI